MFGFGLFHVVYQRNTRTVRSDELRPWSAYELCERMKGHGIPHKMIGATKSVHAAIDVDPVCNAWLNALDMLPFLVASAG